MATNSRPAAAFKCIYGLQLNQKPEEEEEEKTQTENKRIPVLSLSLSLISLSMFNLPSILLL